MATYAPLENAAQRLKTTPGVLRALESLGWIEIVEKDGRAFLTDQHEYKARFILHLQRIRKLNNDQIGRILAVQAPPYRVAEVDRLVAAL